MNSGQEFGELVSLLSKTAPEKLNELRLRFPQHAVALRPGAVLGAGDNLDISCTVAQIALNEATGAADTIRKKLRGRLAASLRFDLISKFAAVCGSGGAVGVLASGAGTDKAMVASTIALVGSLCALLFSYLQRDETQGSVTESYNKLISALVQSGELLRILPVLCPAGESPQLTAALNKANQAAATLNELILRFK